MIIRKHGETHTQFIQRLEAYIEVLQDNNRSLRVLNAEQNKANPKTNRTYEFEARQLFTTVALIENALRNADTEFAQIMAQGQLSDMGFDLVQIESGECLLDGAYNG